MKRLVIVLCAALAFAPAAFADHPSGMGIGLVASGDYGIHGVGGQVGLSLKFSGVPIFWAARLAFNSSFLSLGVTGDKYFTDDNLVSEKGFNLDWFLGLGGYADLTVGNVVGAAIGARLPVGLSWHITKEFELWLDVAPSLGIGISPLNFPDWSVPAELGFRAWLK